MNKYNGYQQRSSFISDSELVSTFSETKSNYSDKKVLLTLSAIIIIAFIGISLPYPIFPLLLLQTSQSKFLIQDVNLKKILLGLILSGYPLGQFIGAPLIGRLSDIYGRKPLLVASLAGASIFYILSALAIKNSHITLLVLARFLTGVFEGNVTLAQAIIVDMSLNKYKYFGGITSCVAIGYIIGPLFGGLLCDSSWVFWFGFDTPFYFAAILTIVTTLITFFIMPGRSEFKQNQIKISHYSLSTMIQKIFSNYILRNLFIIGIFLNLGIDIFYEFYPVLLANKFQKTAFNIAIFNVLYVLSMILTNSYLTYYVSNKISVVTSIAISQLLFVLSLIILVFSSKTTLIYALFILIGIAVALITTISSVQISNNINDINFQGGIMGTMLGVRMLFDSIICLLCGFMLIFSLVLPFIVSILVLTTAFLFLFKIRGNLK